MRPYVSIDIETTGIGEEALILQISAVLDDLVSPISELKTIDLPIKYDKITYAEPYALGMNAELLKKMMDKDFKTYSLDTAMNRLIEFLNVAAELNYEQNGKRGKVLLAGKNVASFDIPKIKKAAQSDYRVMLDDLIHYKTLDVGSLYYDVFKDNVSLSKINELTNRPAVSHNALDDALDVVHAIRHKLGISRE